MSDSIKRASISNKRLVIAAIAFSGLMVFAFANMVEQASAQIRLPLFNRVLNIPIPCLPYCNIDPDNGPRDREIVTPVGTIRLDFSFLSFRGR